MTESLLLAATGRTVGRIEQAYYVTPEGERDTSDSKLELYFTDGSMIRLDSGPGSERLLVAPDPWIDPFIEPLSAVNAEFVANSGKWTKFDVSREPPASSYVGATVIDANCTDDVRGILHACAILTTAGTIHVVVEWDELHAVFD